MTKDYRKIEHIEGWLPTFYRFPILEVRCLPPKTMWGH